MIIMMAAKLIQPVHPVGSSDPVGSSYPVGPLYPVRGSYDAFDIARSFLAATGTCFCRVPEGRIGLTVRSVIDGVFSQTG
jgi:hypothetical protein